MQNGIRLSSTSSVMAGLTIDQFDVGVLAFYFFLTETSCTRIRFINTVCDKRNLRLPDRGDRI